MTDGGIFESCPRGEWGAERLEDRWRPYMGQMSFYLKGVLPMASDLLTVLSFMLLVFMKSLSYLPSTAPFLKKYHGVKIDSMVFSLVIKIR